MITIGTGKICNIFSRSFCLNEQQTSFKTIDADIINYLDADREEIANQVRDEETLKESQGEDKSSKSCSMRLCNGELFWIKAVSVLVM